MRISHEYGHVALHIFYTYPEDEGRWVAPSGGSRLG